MATLDELATDISGMISEYADDINLDLEKQLLITADKIIEYIKTNAPRGSSHSHLADSFISRKEGTGICQSVVIFSKEKGRIVHLLEFGFVHKSGKYVTAKPFMRPAYETFTPKMVDDIKRIIKQGGEQC